MPNLRRAEQSDSEPLVTLINRAYEVERSFKAGDRTDVAHISEMMGRGVFLVQDDADDRPIATVYVEIRDDRAYFGLLSVDPAAQGSGLGRTMVAAAERYAADAGCTAMDIHVLSLRSELPPFYEKLGYAEIGIAEFEDEELMLPCHVIVMSKPLRR